MLIYDCKTSVLLRRSINPLRAYWYETKFFSCCRTSTMLEEEARGKEESEQTVTLGVYLD